MLTFFEYDVIKVGGAKTLVSDRITNVLALVE